MAVLTPPERAIEDLARTAVCPNCGSQPTRPCRTWSDKMQETYPTQVSHLGRLKVARGEAL